MKSVFKLHFLYFGVYFIFVLLAGSFIGTFHTQNIHQFLNSFHCKFADFVFPYVTHIGDGIAVAVIVVGSLFYQKRWVIQIGVAGILSGLLAQILKRFVFGPTLRPFAFFQEQNLPLRLVDGVEMHTAFSFPSGHTTAIFALTTSIVLLLPFRKLDIPLVVIALLVGYSRIYLSQHFLEDVLAGSLLGTGTAILVYFIFLANGIIQNPKWSKPLISF
jgi:membrane-associated phospholipid phosphatase